MLSAMFANWTLTATRMGSPVGKVDGMRMAWWACLIEAAARSVGLKSTEERHDDPREDVKVSVSRLMDV